jgi:hypothetical protein
MIDVLEDFWQKDEFVPFLPPSSLCVPVTAESKVPSPIIGMVVEGLRNQYLLRHMSPPSSYDRASSETCRPIPRASQAMAPERESALFTIPMAYPPCSLMSRSPDQESSLSPVMAYHEKPFPSFLTIKENILKEIKIHSTPG